LNFSRGSQIRITISLSLILVVLSNAGCGANPAAEQALANSFNEESLSQLSSGGAALAKSAGEIVAEVAPEVSLQLEAQPTQAARAGTVQDGPPEQPAPSDIPPAAPQQPAQPAVSQPPVGIQVGFTAPDFTLSTLDGQSISLSSLRGKNVMLNYWTTWCIPCKEEMPVLDQIQRDYVGRNLVILAINGISQDSLEDVKKAVVDWQLTLPVILDEGNVVYEAYQALFLPTSFFIDEIGVIREIQLGSSSAQVLKSKIESLLAY